MGTHSFQNSKLPGREDWQTLFSFLKRLGLEDKDSMGCWYGDPILLYTLSILNSFGGLGSFYEVPPTFGELHKEVSSRLGVIGLTYPDYKTSSGTKKAFDRFFGEAAEAKLIRKIGFREWRENYEYSARSKSRLGKGRKDLFLITGKGVLLFECLLISPLISMNFGSQELKLDFQNPGAGGRSLVPPSLWAQDIYAFAYASRRLRPKWNEKCLRAIQRPIEPYIQEVLSEIKKLFRGSEDNLNQFWDFMNQETRLLREFSLLKEIEGRTSDLLKILSQEKYVRAAINSARTAQEADYVKNVEGYFTTTMSEKKALVSGVIENLVIRRAKLLGMSLDTIQRHAPKKDPFSEYLDVEVEPLI